FVASVLVFNVPILQFYTLSLHDALPIYYLVASREDKESMFLTYSELLNSLDSGAVTKITINNRRLNKANFETSILMPIQGDFREDRKSTRLNSSHVSISYAVFCLKNNNT